MNNPLQNLIMSKNPSQLIQQMIQNNPNGQNIINTFNQMTNGKSQNEVRNIVQNLCKERNIDFNQIEKMVNGRK